MSDDSYVDLDDECPSLPTGPTCHYGRTTTSGTSSTTTTTTTTSTQEGLDYREEFLDAILRVSKWITAVETTRMRREHRKSITTAALAYYEEQYIEQTLFHGEHFTTLWDFDFGQTSLRICLFFELCRLRVVIRETCGPRWDDDETHADFTHLMDKRIMLEKKKCIGLYTLRELEQAFHVLFKYWNSMPYHTEVAAYARRLLDKQATFFCASSFRSEMNLSLFTNSLGSGEQEMDAEDIEQCGPTLAYLFKCQLRYFYVIARLHLTERQVRVPFASLDLANTMPYPYHDIDAAALERLVYDKASRVRSEMTQETRRILFNDLLHPGDREWIHFLRPVSQVTDQMVVNSLHSQEKARFHTESVLSLQDVLQLPEDGLRTGSKSRIVLELFDKMMPYNLRFIRDHVIDWTTLLSRWFDIVTSRKPMLVQWGGHYELFWLGVVYTGADVSREQGASLAHHELPALDYIYEPEHQTIYKTLHMWLRIMAYSNKFTTEWNTVIEPEMRNVLERHVSLELQRSTTRSAGVGGGGMSVQNKDDDDALQQRISQVTRAYLGRRSVALLERERLDVANEHLEDDAMEVDTDGYAGDGRSDDVCLLPHQTLDREMLDGITVPLLTFYK